MSFSSIIGRRDPGLAGAVEAYEQIALLTSTGLPLGEGLRGLAEELGDRHTRPWLLGWAAAIEQGRSLEDSFAQIRNRIPRGLAPLLEATGAGHFAETLERFLAARRTTLDQRAALWQVLAYPLLLLTLAAFVTGLLALSFAEVSLESLMQAQEIGNLWQGQIPFDLETPPLLRLLLVAFEHRNELATALVVCVGLWIALWLSPARYVCAWLTAQIPGYGKHQWFLALAEATRHLHTLTSQSVPLDDAVRWATLAVDHSLLARGGPSVARDIQAGQSLAASLRHRPAVPASVTLLVDWGERRSQLPEMLELVASFCDERAQAELLKVKLLVPPLAFIAVAMLVLGFIGAFYVPMFQFLQMLT